MPACARLWNASPRLLSGSGARCCDERWRPWAERHSWRGPEFPGNEERKASRLASLPNSPRFWLNRGSSAESQRNGQQSGHEGNGKERKMAAADRIDPGKQKARGGLGSAEGSGVDAPKPGRPFTRNLSG